MRRFRIQYIILLIATQALNAQYIFYTTKDDYTLKRANADGSGISTLYTSATGTPSGVTIDLVNNKLYYTDSHSSVAKIISSNLDGSGSSDIITSTQAVSVAVDPDGGKIYYTTRDDYTLKMANLDGSGISTIYTSATGTPEGVALDLTNNKVYFTDSHTSVAKIMRCNLDGSGVSDVITSTQAVSIAVNPDGGKIYYTTKDDYKLKMANLDGSGVSTIYTSATGTPAGVSLDLTNNNVFFTDDHSTVAKIMSCNLDGSGIADVTSSVQAVELEHQYYRTATVNSEPTASSFTASPVYEGSAYTFATSDFGYSDPNGDPLDHIRITAIPTIGSLWIDSDNNGLINGGESAITNGTTITKANLDAGYVKYINQTASSSAFSFDVNDGTNYSNSTYTATLVVTPIPTVTLSLSSSTISENAGSSSIIATLSNLYDKTVTVNLTFSGTATGTVDYSVTGSSVTIAPGNTAGNVTLYSVNDFLDENNETVIIDVSSVTNGSEDGVQQQTVTINDDDVSPSVSFTTDAQSSAGETGTMTITAQLSAVSGRTVTIPFSVDELSTASGTGTDYSITASPIFIAAGSTAANITITISSDLLDEDNETIMVNMGTPVNATKGAISSHTATITDDDATPSVTFTTATQTSTGESGTMIITAQLSAASGKVVTVPFTVNGSGTATGGGTDFSVTPGPLSMAAGSTTANITISIAADAIDEQNETVIIDMETPTNATLGATTSHTATITDDDDPPAISFASAGQSSENESGTMTITVQLSSLSAKTVDFSLTIQPAGTASPGGTDYSMNTGPFSITPGITETEIPITITNDLLDEENETIVLSFTALSNATLGNTAQHTATITDDDALPTVTFTSASQSSANETGTMTITAQLSAESGRDVTVPFSATGSSTALGNGKDYTLASGPLIIPAGTLSGNITITLVNDAIDEATEVIIVEMGTLTNAAPGDITSHTLTIVDDDPAPSVSFVTATQSTENESETLTITAQLSEISGRNVTVPFSVNSSGTATGNGTDYSITESPLIIPAGSSSASITLILTNDELDEEDETVIIDMGSPTNATAGTITTHTVTITDDDNAPFVNFTASSQSSENETGTLTLTVQLSAISTKNITVPFTVNASSEAIGGGKDYSISSGPVTIPAGSSAGTITINITPDAIDENNETIIVNLGTPVNAQSGTVTSHTASITDDDASPTVIFTSVIQASQNESGTMNITAQLSTPSERTVTIPFSVSGSAISTGNEADFSITGSPVTIPAGNTSTNITITILPDTRDESNETVIASIGTPTNAIRGPIYSHTATITDDDSKPVIDPSQSFTINENKTGSVGYVTASDNDAGTVYKNWTIVNNADSDGDGNNAFTINASTGELSVLDIEDLNREVHSLLNIEVTVSDGTNTSDPELVVVYLRDVNDLTPVITPSQGFFVSIYAPLGAEIGTVKASDGDVTPTTFQDWSISTNVDPDHDGTLAFGIDEASGVLVVTDTSDLNVGDVHSLGITVSDGQNTSIETDVIVNVLAINSVPVITNGAEVSVSENTTTALNIEVIDEDMDQLVYTITNGIDQEHFEIDASTGVLSFKIPPDFESPADSNQDNIYLVEIKVDDQKGGYDIQSFAITVLQANDKPVLNDYSFTIEENSANGTEIGTVTASDQDIGQEHSYAIIAGNREEYFKINKVNGLITVNNHTGLDFERVDVFELTVEATDNGVIPSATSATVTINLTDVNEKPVVIDQSFSIKENSENGTIVGTVEASDPEETALSYKIENTGTAIPFIINVQTGLLSVSNSSLLDFEVTQDISFNVIVSDTSLSSTLEITVSLENVNDNYPDITNNAYYIDENPSFGELVGYIEISDPDGDLSTEYTIEEITGNENSIFTFNISTREILVNIPDSVDYERRESYAIRIILNDGTYQVMDTIFIHVNDVNETTIEEPIAAQLKIYPVPAKDKISISCTHDDIEQITIIDVSGRIVDVYDLANYSENTAIDVSALIPGKYYLRIKGKHTVYSEKIIVVD